MASGNDNMRSARETYSGFIEMFKWGSVVVAIAAAAVVYLIA